MGEPDAPECRPAFPFDGVRARRWRAADALDLDTLESLVTVQIELVGDREPLQFILDLGAARRLIAELAQAIENSERGLLHLNLDDTQ